ncbi:MAG: hypothetical protein EOO01_37175 [Chitinophagaceae bacterium]|nr:MAG: hypothetical protein EOO01_37175 [Chitinophagaceae bacterium]
MPKDRDKPVRHVFMRIAILFICIMTAFAACTDQPSDDTSRKDGFTKTLKTRGDTLYHEVMEGHDVGMAKMGQISGYIKKVKASIDSLEKQKSPDQKKLEVLKSVAADLNQADYSMNRWMEEFKIDSAKNNETVRLTYLEAERDKIARVKERILGSLQRADSLFQTK